MRIRQRHQGWFCWADICPGAGVGDGVGGLVVHHSLRSLEGGAHALDLDRRLVREGYRHGGDVLVGGVDLLGSQDRVSVRLGDYAVVDGDGGGIDLLHLLPIASAHDLLGLRVDQEQREGTLGDVTVGGD